MKLDPNVLSTYTGIQHVDSVTPDAPSIQEQRGDLQVTGSPDCAPITDYYNTSNIILANAV